MDMRSASERGVRASACSVEWIGGRSCKLGGRRVGMWASSTYAGLAIMWFGVRPPRALGERPRRAALSPPPGGADGRTRRNESAGALSGTQNETQNESAGALSGAPSGEGGTRECRSTFGRNKRRALDPPWCL